MKDFFTYISEETTEAVIAFEETEFLVVLFTSALHGVLNIFENDRKGLQQLAKLDVLGTIDMLLNEEQEAFTIYELEFIKAMYQNTVQS